MFGTFYVQSECEFQKTHLVVVPELMRTRRYECLLPMKLSHLKLLDLERKAPPKNPLIA